MGDVIYIADRVGTWEEIYTATNEVNKITLQVFRHTLTKNVTLSLMNGEGEAIEIPLMPHQVIEMFKSIITSGPKKK